jgi:hypothetical protein
MHLHQLLGRWLQRPKLGAQTRPRSRRQRLQVQSLEDRTVPANFTAASVADLVADINAGNQTAEADTITLVPGITFTLIAVNNTTDGPNGLPVIAAGEDLTIVGNGDAIERSTATGTPAFRLFDVAAGATLTIQNLTLQGGYAAAGGAVLSRGNLDLTGVTVQNNVVRGFDGFNDPVFSGSWAGGNGMGGGLYSTGSLALDGCTIQNNLAVGGHGGDGVAGIGDSEGHSGPHFNYPGTAGGNALGGGIYIGGGTAAISNSTFYSNTAQGGDGGDGYSGGSGGGNGGTAFGGGLYAGGGATTLRGVTITSNRAIAGNGGHGTHGNPGGAAGQGIGGGICIDPAASVALDTFTFDHVKKNHASTSDNDIYGSYAIIL